MPIEASCHCGETVFEVTEAPASVTRCTCSLCAKRGALWAYYTPAQFRLLSPPESVATYLWGSRTVKHHFCASCGCGTYSESPDWSTGQGRFRQSQGCGERAPVRRFRSRCRAGEHDRRQEFVVSMQGARMSAARL
ncbi:hypothetical protein ACVW0J_006713 [Bradyrhizobium sp. i1.7.7]